MIFCRVRPQERDAAERAAKQADLTLSAGVRAVILQKLGLVREV